VLNSETIGKCL